MNLALNALINIIFEKGLFNRIENLVKQQADKAITSAEKRKGVLAQAEVIGIKASESILRLAIELAVLKLKNK